MTKTGPHGREGPAESPIYGTPWHSGRKMVKLEQNGISTGKWEKWHKKGERPYLGALGAERTIRNCLPL